MTPESLLLCVKTSSACSLGDLRKELLFFPSGILKETGICFSMAVGRSGLQHGFQAFLRKESQVKARSLPVLSTKQATGVTRGWDPAYLQWALFPLFHLGNFFSKLNPLFFSLCSLLQEKKNPYFSNNALQREHLAFLSFKFLYYISIYLSLCVHSCEEAAGSCHTQRECGR